MRIGLMLDPYGEKSPGGLGRAINEMARALIAADTEDTFTVFVKHKPAADPKFPGNNWKLKVLGGKSLFISGARNMDQGLDLYIFYNPIVPLFFLPKRSIVVVHDFAYLELPNRSLKETFNAFALRLAHKLSLWKATKIVAISEAAKQSTIQHFGIDPNKIEVIYNGFVATGSAPEPIAVSVKFFLFAGVLKERKNVLGVIKAFAEFVKNNPEYSLVIAGKKGGAYYDKCEALVKEMDIVGKVQFLGYVTDGQLAYLYTKATALVFPSFIEGFGMPVLEAMSAGLPVITSNTGALAEVAGNAAVLADPHDPSNIARGMAEISNDPVLRAALIEKGKARAGQFSWEKNAKGLKRLVDTL